MKKLLLLLLALVVSHGALAQASEAPTLDAVQLPLLERPAASPAPKGATGQDLVIEPTYFYTYLLSRTPRILDSGIQVYACCPGWCRTDMGGQSAMYTYEGADTPYFLMNVSDKVDLTIQGEFFSKRTVNSLE